MGSSTEYNSLIEDNEYLVVTGIISSYKDVYQIIDVTSLSYGYSLIEISTETLTDLSPILFVIITAVAGIIIKNWEVKSE